MVPISKITPLHKKLPRSWRRQRQTKTTGKELNNLLILE